MVHLVVEMAYLQLGLEIDAIVVERALAVPRLLAALAHHDDRRLDGGDAGQHEIEQDERVGVERIGGVQVGGDPDAHANAENNEEAPASAEGRQHVGGSFAECPAGWLARLEVLRDELALGEALGHLTIELAQLAALGQQQLLDIGGAVAIDLGTADEGIRAELRMVAADPVGDLPIDEIERNELPSIHPLAGQRADQGFFRHRWSPIPRECRWPRAAPALSRESHG